MSVGLGLFANISIGSVYAADEDDWDVTDKTFMFQSTDSKRHFR
jgi:hypothetical protein